MRALLLGTAALAAGCSNKAEQAAAADARAAGFVPPSLVTRLDYGAMQERRFRRLDRDGDDRLAAAELPRIDSRLLRLDRNHDGGVTFTEFGEGQMARFDAMDLNGDGTLTADERVEARGS